MICGNVLVPEDRDKSLELDVHLAVAIFYGPGGKYSKDPILVLHGGPGMGMLKNSAAYYSTFIEPLTRERDVIFFDQRGVGFSKPSLACPEIAQVYLQDIQGQIAVDVRDETYTNAMLECRTRLEDMNVDPGAYTTLASAADVRDILLALKYPTANLYGLSYGTRLAQMVMREYPWIVSSATLDSVLPLETRIYNEGSATSEYALDTLFSGCEADPACKQTYPDLEKRYTELIQKLDTNPIKTTVILPLGSRKVSMDGLSITDYLLWAMQSQQLIQNVPITINRISTGDYSTLRYATLYQVLSIQDVSVGAYLSINCHEQVYATSPEELGTDLSKHPDTETIGLAKIFGSGEALFKVCNLWKARPKLDGENEPLRADIPTLIISGKYDPITPPDYGKLVASYLNHAYFYEFPNSSHTATFGTDPCPLQVVVAFLQNPNIQPEPSCWQEIKPMSFVVPYTGDTPLSLTPYSDIKTGLVSVVPAKWNAIGYGFFVQDKLANPQTMIGVQTDPIAISGWIPWLQKNFNGLAGFDKTPVKTGEHKTPGLSWTIYHTTSQSLPVDLAFARQDTQTILVLMQSHPDERDAMYETVFLPVVDATRLNK
jgi:pimeloyl-ACP methyl ester carboxylesterase